MSQDNDLAMNRRDFVTTAAAAAGLCCLAGSAVYGQATTQPAAAEPLDVGLKSDYAKDGPTMTWVKDHHVIVMRESGKLYAMTSKCTHRGCDVADDGMQLTCPCHNSAFDYSGAVTQAPAKRALPRYGITVNDDGHVMVDTKKTFPQSKWDDAASFITIA